ncbi:Translation machinery-associated protein 46 [Penicillium brasilianum]|uniref:Translation machinery-associated protein 46 n=1 Tax=Penicillium brasilianum TaxID=104259 RepID=A0A1S9RR46_PENBI|nr:Translation machinery-associated protein 46 [Penicillium brasilianum]
MPPKKADAPKKKQSTVADKVYFWHEERTSIPGTPFRAPKSTPHPKRQSLISNNRKKGGAAKKQIQQMQAMAKSNKDPDAKRKEAEKEKREAEKRAAELAKKEAAELFKPVQAQKVPFGVDPKTVLCMFHKKGGCEKGKKCKFSHDLNIERKAAKKDLYTDSRDGEEGEEKKKADTMDNWDEEKLRSVVMSKHGNPRTTTDKVCKYFIEAVENQKYGWFWVCPNGGDKCMYKHSLPPGFVLKTKEQKAAEKALMDKSPLNTLTLEDWLESERHKLTGTLTPVNPETFAKWKKERLDKKAAEAEAQKAKEATGRAMFESGDWKDEEESSEDEDEEEDDVWNLVALRNETERMREQNEEERVAKLTGVETPLSNDDAIAQEAAG